MRNNINNQLDATITNLIDNYNQLNMFRAIILPILKSTRLWYNAPTMLPAGSIDGALYHSLVLLRMGKIIARNMLSWLKLLKNCYCCIKLVVYASVSVMCGHTNIKNEEVS